MTKVKRVAAIPAVLGVLSLALVLGGCQATTPKTDTPVPVMHTDLVGSWNADYANDDGNRVTVTYELYDDQTFRRVTIVTRVTAQLVVQQGDDAEVLSRTVVTGTWEIKPGEGDGGTVQLHVTGCVGDACGSGVDVGDTLEVSYTATDDGMIHLEVAPDTPATREPPPAMDPARDLIGTYRATVDGDVVTLTFTRSRWIRHVASQGLFVGCDDKSGGWEATDAIVTKKWTEIDEDGMIQTRSAAKAYAWGNDDRSVLLMDPWESAENGGNQRSYIRVDDPLPETLTGVWKTVMVNERLTHGLEEEWSYSINSDGTFTFMIDRPEVPGARSDFRVDADRWIVDQSEYFLTLRGTRSAAQPDNPANHYYDKVFRNGYAPTNEKNQIVFSMWFDEQMRTDLVWSDNERHPYGCYWLILTRQT